jgi:DNA-directed RNA polymerase specialized sigma24 family protein
MPEDGDKKYVENIHTIDSLLERQRRKWALKAVAWMDYDDVKQIIRIHIYKKWHLWDESKPIEPWVNRIISNQIKNLLRNNYKNFARPCLNCPHSAGGEDCTLTKSGTQDESCSLFKKWSIKKRPGFNMKLPVPLENHAHELEPNEKSYTDLERLTNKINLSMKQRLSERYYRAYEMMCIETKSEAEIAEYMGYKSTEKNRKAGYKQIKNLRETFRQHVIDILKSEDIIY